MFKNRSILVIAVLSLLLVTIAISRPSSGDPTLQDLHWTHRPAIVPVTGGQEELALDDRPTASSLGKAIRELRQEELSLYNNSMASSLGGITFYEYRLGQFRREELCNRSENGSVSGAAFHEYCRGG